MHVNLIKHFLDTRLDLMVSKSLINCHVKGVDSILFDDTPSARIRMFIARPEHELWKNNPNRAENWTAAYHPHHCGLTLQAVKGFSFINYLAKEVQGHDYNTYDTFKFEYQSKISKGDCAFKLLGEAPLAMLDIETVDTQITLAANELHTVAVPKKIISAWTVYETKEDVDYKPICYSNHDLTQLDTSELYKPMDEQYLRQTLRTIYPNL